MFLNNRYYDPAIAAFTAVDPLVGKTGTPYIYGAGNPTTYSDPTGLEAGCGATSSGSSCGSAHDSAERQAYMNAVAKSAGAEAKTRYYDRDTKFSESMGGDDERRLFGSEQQFMLGEEFSYYQGSAYVEPTALQKAYGGDPFREDSGAYSTATFVGVAGDFEPGKPVPNIYTLEDWALQNLESAAMVAAGWAGDAVDAGVNLFDYRNIGTDTNNPEKPSEWNVQGYFVVGHFDADGTLTGTSFEVMTLRMTRNNSQNAQLSQVSPDADAAGILSARLSTPNIGTTFYYSDGTYVDAPLGGNADTKGLG